MLNADGTTTTRLMDAAGASAYGYACAIAEGKHPTWAADLAKGCAELFTLGKREGRKGQARDALAAAVWPPARFAYAEGAARGEDEHAAKC